MIFKKLRIRLSNGFKASFFSKFRYLVECGGRGSGKSEFCARKVFYRCWTEKCQAEEGGPIFGHRFLVLRKVRARCRQSVAEVFRRVLQESDVIFHENKTDHSITFHNPAGLLCQILFDGLDDPEKIKSIKGITGVWIEEATEFSERDFMGVDLVLREPGPPYFQVILSFNPDEAEAPWLKERFFDHKDPDAFVHESTVEDNPIKAIRDAYRKRLEAIKDAVYRQIYLFGKWAVAKGIIFAWDVQPIPEDVKIESVYYGLDFGYSIDPAAVVRIHQRADDIWLEQVIYQTGLTNQLLASLMRECGIKKNDAVYADSAEPKSITELCTAGFNVLPSIKGADSVRVGIDHLLSMNVHIMPGSDDIIDERKTYKWRVNRKGETVSPPEPVDFKNHAMDATRGAVYTHRLGQGKVAAAQSKEDFY